MAHLGFNCINIYIYVRASIFPGVLIYSLASKLSCCSPPSVSQFNSGLISFIRSVISVTYSLDYMKSTKNEVQYKRNSTKNEVQYKRKVQIINYSIKGKVQGTVLSKLKGKL